VIFLAGGSCWPNEQPLASGRFRRPHMPYCIGKAGKGRGAKGGKGGSNTGKSGKGKAGKSSSKPTPKPGPGTPPGFQTPGSPPPTQTPGSPPPTQSPGTPPPTQSQSPTETEKCSGVTEDMFRVMAPNAEQPNSYTGFCNAVASWNGNQNTADVKSSKEKQN
jgi:hypothetical protein